MNGRVRWFDAVQGVGVAELPDGGHQIHLYYKEIRREGYRALEPGDEISFWVDDSVGGRVARDIRWVRSLPRE